ncbi:MAG: Asd/ArgC dimerization domain-containing protein [Hyphomicrobium sp.]
MGLITLSSYLTDWALGGATRQGVAQTIEALAGSSIAMAELVAKGEAEIAIHQISEIIPVKGVTLVATPGCHVTAATLALAPLVRLGLIETTGIVVNSITGVSGAGRALKHTSLFCTADEDVTAYGLLDHRHTPEIEQEVGAQVLFTPHLAPLSRGLLATCYARPSGVVTTHVLLDALTEFYRDEPFVVVPDASPSTKATLGSNVAHVTARFDERTGTVMALCAIDNLAKGASGGAVQAANVALGLPESAGLSLVGMYP